MLDGTNEVISEDCNVNRLPGESPTAYRFWNMVIITNDFVARCPACGSKLILLQTKEQGMSFEIALVCLNTNGLIVT